MSILHRLVSNTIQNFPDRSKDLLADYFNDATRPNDSNGEVVYEKAWNKATMYDQAFINQNIKTNNTLKGTPVIQNEDIFADNFIKNIFEDNIELKSSIDRMYQSIHEISSFGKETNEKYIAKELTSKLSKVRELDHNLKLLDDYISNDTLNYQQDDHSNSLLPAFSESNLSDTMNQLSYFYLFRNAVSKAQFVLEKPIVRLHHHNRGVSNHQTRYKQYHEYAPVVLAEYTTDRGGLIQQHYGTISPPHTNNSNNMNTNINTNTALSSSSSTKSIPSSSAKPEPSPSLSIQQRYTQDVQLYGNIICYMIPSHLFELEALAWATHQILTEATSRGSFNIFPLAFKTENCSVTVKNTRLFSSSSSSSSSAGAVSPSVQQHHQRGGIRFMMEFPSCRKFDSINNLLLASFLISHPNVLTQWCSQLSSMTQFLIQKAHTGIFLSHDALLSGNVYIRNNDGRLLLSSCAFRPTHSTPNSYPNHMLDVVKSIANICYSFTHSLLSTALCLSRTLILHPIHRDDRCTKKVVMVHLRQGSSLLLSFPDILKMMMNSSRSNYINDASSTVDFKLDIHSSNQYSVKNKLQQSSSFSSSSSSSSSSSLSNRMYGVDTNTANNILDIHYNCINIDGALDHTVAAVQTIHEYNSNNNRNNDNSNNDSSIWGIEIQALAPGKVLIDISAGSKGILFNQSNNNNHHHHHHHHHQVLYYEYEILIMILPKESIAVTSVAHSSHKSLDTVELTVFLEEAHRLRNHSLLFGSQCLGIRNNKTSNKTNNSNNMNDDCRNNSKYKSSIRHRHGNNVNKGDGIMNSSSASSSNHDMAWRSFLSSLDS